MKSVSGTLVREEVVASLWCGYGTISRLYFSDPPCTIIRKRVSVPTTQGPNTDVSHVRKVKSYEVERFFYHHLSRYCTASPVPDVISVAEGVCDDESVFMQDLSVSHVLSYKDSNANAKLVLSWLSRFHATFWHHDGPVVSVYEGRGDTDGGVWEEGSYWCLRHRGEEYQALSGRWKRLAVVVDDLIRQETRTHGTLVHGDCKAANVALNKDNTACVLYDFQYVGRSLGMRDVVYFLISSVGGLHDEMDDLLRFHHAETCRALRRCGKEEAATAYTESCMLLHYDLCLVDYYRFMLGWGIWGDSGFAKKQVHEILERRGW